MFFFIGVLIGMVMFDDVKISKFVLCVRIGLKIDIIYVGDGSEIFV